ncbi:MAG: helix-turn-helix domain-containing protein [Hominenteromicrobium sp.]
MSNEIECLQLTEEILQESGGRVLHQFGVPSTYKIHTHDFYELFLVPKGSAVHLINGRSQLLTEGSFVLIRPGDVHRYDFFNNADFELLDIGIPTTLFTRLCAYLQLDRAQFDAPALPLHCVLSGSTLSDVKNKLLKSQQFRDPKAGTLYMMSLFPFLIQLFLLSPAPEAFLPQWFSALLEKMDEPENYIAGLPRLLELANMSQEHLTRSFHRYIGLTPTAYINGKRMGLAARLLLESDMPVIEVGGACGFNSLSRFYRLFSERYGCPPKAFRENFRAAPPLPDSPSS